MDAGDWAADGAAGCASEWAVYGAADAVSVD
jgi:hypothetical protein